MQAAAPEPHISIQYPISSLILITHSLNPSLPLQFSVRVTDQDIFCFVINWVRCLTVEYYYYSWKRLNESRPRKFLCSLLFYIPCFRCSCWLAVLDVVVINVSVQWTCCQEQTAENAANHQIQSTDRLSSFHRQHFHPFPRHRIESFPFSESPLSLSVAISSSSSSACHAKHSAFCGWWSVWQELMIAIRWWRGMALQPVVGQSDDEMNSGRLVKRGRRRRRIKSWQSDVLFDLKACSSDNDQELWWWWDKLCPVRQAFHVQSCPSES